MACVCASVWRRRSRRGRCVRRIKFQLERILLKREGRKRSANDGRGLRDSGELINWQYRTHTPSQMGREQSERGRAMAIGFLGRNALATLLRAFIKSLTFARQLLSSILSLSDTKGLTNWSG